MARCPRSLIVAGLSFVFLQFIQAFGLSEFERTWNGLPYGAEYGRVASLNASPDPAEKSAPWMEQVGLHPKVYVFHNFLSDEERRHIIRQAAPEMRRSMVSGPKGEGVVDPIRTSYGMFITRLMDPVIARIENRISLLTHLPLSHQEDIQVLRYTQGQTYGAHYDSATRDSEPGPHSRHATFLMYLSDVEEGGETAFPHGSEWVDPSIPRKLEEAGVKLSECAKGHVAYKPSAGDAVLFYSYHANGTMDTASMHTGCPVIKGIKWAAPVWIHSDEFNPAALELARRSGRNAPVLPEEPGLCQDRHSQCARWAKAGECTKNPGFMVGGVAPGACRLACGACKPCKPGDVSCINDNREKGGYLRIEQQEMEWLGLDWWLSEVPSPEL